MSLYVKYRKVVPFFRKALIAKADAHIPGHQMTYKGKVVYLHNLGKHVDTAAVFVENSFNYGPGAGALFTQYCITAENIRYFHFLAGKRVAFGTQTGVFLFAVQLIVISGPVKNALHYCKIQLMGVYHFQKIFRVVNGNVQRPPAGGQIIGLEMAENLHALGLDVTVADMARQVMPGLFDADMAGYIKKKLKDSGIKVLTQTALQAVDGEEKVSAVVTGAGRLSADIAVMALGIRPSTGFLADSGIEMVKGAIKVDENMRTNVADVYAAGDCALVYNSLTKGEQWSAMGSTANITARVLAQNLCGGDVRYGGCLGTGVAKLLANLNCGRTGLTHKQALKAGYNAVSVVCATDDKAHYYTGASSFVTKLTADADSGRLLGIQVIGAGAVDKMVDIAVVGISQAMKVSDFDTLDFAYAPPFSTAIHPFVTACYVLENKMSGEFETISPEEYAATGAKDYKVVDVQAAATIPGASWADLDRPQTMENKFAKDEKILLVCTKGKRAYMMQKKLKALGYTNTKVLEGGVTFNTVKVQRTGTKLPAEEIKRVKGLGCLQDKRYDDVFNVRVITRNGKLTSAEQQAVAEAAEKFGSGEATMTTRLTLEIQGVQYDRLEELFRFLEQSGLETGGTGSKVRPVVSCKGTTCQYGLIDTFDLSEKLHNLFYKGYHEVALPHKFKIAVGGCPNNCVKPDLNDLGFVGLIVPNAVRRLAGVDMRFDIGLCAVCGAFITVLSDLVARVLFAPAELPAGIIMAVLGSPFFLYLLIKRRRSYDTIQ